MDIAFHSVKRQKVLGGHRVISQGKREDAIAYIICNSFR